MDTVHLDFSKVFVTVFHKILMEKLMKDELDVQTLRWTENWLNDRTQKVVIDGTKSSSRPVTSSIPVVNIGSNPVQNLHYCTGASLSLNTKNVKSGIVLVWFSPMRKLT